MVKDAGCHSFAWRTTIFCVLTGMKDDLLVLAQLEVLGFEIDEDIFLDAKEYLAREKKKSNL